MERRLAALLAVAALVVAGAARAADAAENDNAEALPRSPRVEVAPPARGFDGWTPYRSELAVTSVDPEGFDTQYLFGLKRRLWKSDATLLRDSYAIVGIAPAINPSYSRVGPAFEAQPVAFFRLSGGVELVQYFATFGNLQSFSSPLADASDRARARDARDAYAARAIHATLEPMLQARVGKIAARVHTRAEYWDATLRRGDTVFYASNTDLLVPNRGFVLTESAELLLLPADGLVLGLRATETHALYRRSDFRPGETPSDPNRHAQAGALAAWSPAHARSFLGKPTLFVLTGWYLEHRDRAAGAAARATPNVIAGVSFEIDGARAR